MKESITSMCPDCFGTLIKVKDSYWICCDCKKKLDCKYKEANK